jgi:hypothetical protein
MRLNCLIGQATEKSFSELGLDPVLSNQYTEWDQH